MHNIKNVPHYTPSREHVETKPLEYHLDEESRQNMLQNLNENYSVGEFFNALSSSLETERFFLDQSAHRSGGAES